MIDGETTNRVLAAAFKVHTRLGPGLLESAYRECLIRQLTLDGLKVTREIPIPICYEDLVIPGAFRADLIVNDSVLVELKAVEDILPIHQAQTLTYLRLSRIKVGLLINFNTRHLRHGIHRLLCPTL